MHCTNCGEKLSEESKFCENCGHKVEIEEKKPKVKNEKIESVVSHLEYLGYVVEQIDNEEGFDRYVFSHSSKPRIWVNTLGDWGLLFYCNFRIDKEKVQKDRGGALEAVNKLNGESSFCNYSLFEDSSGFNCAATYYSEYNKKDFGTFLELFESDISARLRNKELEKYS